MNQGISSMNLSEALVASVIEAYLNEQMLKQPHAVKGLNFCDGFVWVELEPGAEPAATMSMLPALSGAAARQAVRQALLPDAAEGAKTPTEEDKHAIRDMVIAQPTRSAASIANELGLNVKTVAYHVTQARKTLAAGNGNNGTEVVDLGYVPPAAGSNGDGHGDPSVTEQEAPQALPAEEPKRRGGGSPKLTADDKFTILRVRTEYGTPVKDIARQYGVSEATIYDVLAAARAEYRSAAKPGGA